MNILHVDSQKGKKKSSESATLWIDGQQLNLPLEQLRDDDYVENLRRKMAEAKKPITVSLKNLLDWPPKFRLNLLDFLASINVEVKYRPITGQSATTDLFSAVLSRIVDNIDLDQFERGKLAALEAAVLRYPHALDGACDRIVKRLRKLRRGVRAAVECLLGRLQYSLRPRSTIMTSNSPLEDWDPLQGTSLSSPSEKSSVK
jgi:hypothetical protein